MTLSGVSDGNLLVFRMLFNFILPPTPLSLLMLGHKSESIRGSNMCRRMRQEMSMYVQEDFRHTACVCFWDY